MSDESPIERWVRELCSILDVPRHAVDVPALLDLARDAAHNVDRPAAPVTTFIVGYAAGLRRGDQGSATPIRSAADLVRAWPGEAS